MKTSERSDANYDQSFHLAENQVEAAFISLNVGPIARLRHSLPICLTSLSQSDLESPNRVENPRRNCPKDSIQVHLRTITSMDPKLILDFLEGIESC